MRWPRLDPRDALPVAIACLYVLTVAGLGTALVAGRKTVAREAKGLRQQIEERCVCPDGFVLQCIPRDAAEPPVERGAL